MGMRWRRQLFGGRWGGQAYLSKRHLFVDKIITLCLYIKYVSGFEWFKNTSLEELNENVYCVMDYLKEHLVGEGQASGGEAFLYWGIPQYLSLGESVGLNC